MKKRDVNELAAELGLNVIIRYKYLIFLIITVLFVLGIFGAQRIKIDSSNESFFAKTDEVVQKNDRFKDIFGNEEFVFVFIEGEELFTHDNLTYIKELSRDLEENLPFVKEVISLGNIDFIETIEDELWVEELIGEDIPVDSEELALIKEKALSKDAYVDRIITKDAKKTGIAISFTRIPQHVWLPVDSRFSSMDQESWSADKVLMASDIYSEEDSASVEGLSKISDPRKLIPPALNVIMERNSNPDLKVIYTGIPVVDYESEKIILSEGAFVGLISLIISTLLLLLIFRSFRAVAAPFLVIVSTIVILFGITGWVGFPFGMANMITMPLVMVISVSYSIHFINHFLQDFRLHGRRMEAVRYTFEHSAWPCLVTVLTTAVGFASFMIVPLTPIRNMGITCALGVFIAYLLTLIIIPAFFSIGRDKEIKGQKEVKVKESSSMSRLSDLVLKIAPLTVVLTLGLVALAAIFIPKIKIDTQLSNMIGEKVNFVKDTNYITDNLGGLYSYEVLIELPEDDLAKNPAVLETVERMDRMVEGWDSTKVTMSINDIIKDLNMVMNNNDKGYYTIPASADLIAQYLLLYEMSGGDGLSDWVDFNFKTLRLSVQVDSFTLAMSDRFAEIEQFAMQNLPEGTKVTVTGDMPILLKMIDSLTVGQLQSILIAMLVITIFMIIILKSFRLGLLSMIPNILPVGVIGIIMGLFDINLDLITVMISPMIIGIAVDDTVHYFIHFRQEYDRCGDYKIANRETFKKIGKAIIFTSIILVIGFAVFGFSNINSLFNMAILSGAGIFSALVADLLIAPAIFIYLKPLDKRAGAKKRRLEPLAEEAE